MRVCLVGHYAKYLDEGVRNIAFHLSHELAKHHQIRTINIQNFLGWKDIQAFHPDIIHFILSPTIIGIITAKAISLSYKKAKTVISAPNPIFYFKWLMPLFKPDMVLVQSLDSQKLFQDIGCQTAFLPNGVDIERFVPVSLSTKAKLREKYGIDKDKFVILHVGSIRRERNLELLKKMQAEDNQVLIIGKRKEYVKPSDNKLSYELKQKGCLVWEDYFEHIEEIYALSDCYVFPMVDRRDCVEMPLSLLEAMSCNLPVISAKFGALASIFRDVEGLFFVNKEEDFIQTIKQVKDFNIEIKTREKVLSYSWESVSKRLEEIYRGMLEAVE